MRPLVGSVMRLSIFSKRAFARSVAANDPYDLTLTDFEADILQRPELFLCWRRYFAH